MTIEQLEFLIAVAKCRQFTAAANELYISQSSLSKQISALEKELGIKLLVRNTRNFSLTPAGEEVLEKAGQIMAEYENLTQKVASFRRPHGETVAIGAVPILNHYGITEKLLRFRKENPLISIKVTETVTADIFEMLDRQEIDIGIIRTPYLHDSCYDILPILKDEHILLVSDRHPLASSKEVGIEQVADDHFMLMDTDPYYTRFYLKILRDGGIHPIIEYTKMRLETIKVCVMENTCISLMMHRVADYHKMSGTQVLRIKDHPFLYLAMVTKKGARLSAESQMLQNFLYQK